MDVETVNRLHKTMKLAEAKWLAAGKFSENPYKLNWTGDVKILYDKFILAYKDYKSAADELDKQTA